MSPTSRDQRSRARRRWLVPRLLSGRPDLSRAEKDHLFAAIMGDVEAAAPQRRRIAPLLALLAAAAILVLVPVVVLRSRSSPPELASRGDATAATFSVFCGGANAPCRPGDTLMFDVTSGRWRYFAAFARREDGAIIWYSPETAGIDLAASAAGVLATGVVLDVQHQPGRYQVHGVFSQVPLDREQIRARFTPDGAPVEADDTEIVIRGFDIR